MALPSWTFLRPLESPPTRLPSSTPSLEQYVDEPPDTPVRLSAPLPTLVSLVLDSNV